MKFGATGEAGTNHPETSRRIDGAEVVGRRGHAEMLKKARLMCSVRGIVALSRRMAQPSQIGKIRMTEGRTQSNPLEMKGEGKQVQQHGQAAGGARTSRVSNRFKCQSIQSIEALTGFLQCDVLSPHNRGIRHGRSDHFFYWLLLGNVHLSYK